MRRLSFIFGLTLTSAVALASANAADIYVPGPAGPGGYKDVCCAPSWAGFYFGANGGYGWNANSSRPIDINGTAGPFNFSVPTAGPDPAGGFGGAQVGYNVQRGHFVFGAEADIQISDISDTKSGPITNATVNGAPVNLTGAGFSSTSTALVDWFGTLRGRLGYAWDTTLIYATGGFAYGKVDHSLNASFTNAVPPFTLQLAHLGRNDIDTGFVVGGGVEFKPVWGFFGPNWSVKAEYQYIDLGHDKLSGSGFFGFLPLTSNNVDTAFHTVRIGLNYHIPAGYEPLK